MNKKVLSAILFSALFAGTGTFTSCIDTDEPAGIEELRGAKAELLKAQAAVQLAEEAYKRAWVANQELMNEAQRLTNEAQKIDNDMKALDLQIKEAKTEAEIAGYLLAKQQKENELAVLAETFKAGMLKAQAETVKAQSELDAAIKAAEVAKLTLTAEQQAQLAAVISEMTTARNSMTAAYANVSTMQDNLRKALIGNALTTTLASLEWKLLDAQNTVKVNEIAVADAEKMLALAKDFDTETWAAQLDSLRADSLDAVQKKAAAQVDLDAFYAGAEYQAAEKAFQKAVETLGDSTFTAGEWDDINKVYVKGEMNNVQAGTLIPNTEDSTLYAKKSKAATDSAAAVNGTYVYGKDYRNQDLTTTFKLKSYKSEPLSESLVKFINQASSLHGVDGLIEDNVTGEYTFEYSSVNGYTESAYRTDSANYKIKEIEDDLDNYVANSEAMQTLMMVEGWVDALSAFKVDTNGLAWSQQILDVKRQDSIDAQKAFDEAKAAWQILVDAVNGKKTVAPTDSVKKANDGTVAWSADIKGAVAEYNDSVASLTAAVAKYNTLVDSLAKSEKAMVDAAKADTVAKAKAVEYFNKYYTQARALAATSEDQDSIDAIKAREKTDYTKFNDYLLPVKAAMAKAAVDLDIVSWETDNAATLEGYKTAAATKALTAGYGTDGALTAVKTALDNANTAMRTLVSDVATAQAGVESEYTKYLDFLEADYGQRIAATNLNKIPVAGADTIAVGEAKYVTYDGGRNIDWNVIAAEYGIATIAPMKNKANTADSIVNLANGVFYGKYVVDGNAISDAVLANMSVTEINKKLAINKLVAKSRKAFGTIFNWDTADKETRLVEVTEEMVKADMEKNTSNTYANYGKLGALMAAKADLELVLSYKDADKLIEPLLETIEAQFAALKAEISANSAIVAAVEKKADEAWLAYEAGKAMVEKALADRDALSAEAEAEIELLEAIIAEKKAVIQSATAQLEALFPGVDGLPGALTTEKLVQAWESQVVTAKQTLVSAEDAVARAEKEIELFKAGEYDQAYSIEFAKVNLEAAQEAYDAAVEYYEFVVAQFKALLAAYSK